MVERKWDLITSREWESMVMREQNSIKNMLLEWKKTKSISLANEICEKLLKEINEE